MKLKNKVAIITGAFGGIGDVIARRFANEGAQLALVDVSESPGHVETARVYSGDLTQIKFCHTLAKNIINDFGKINHIYFFSFYKIRNDFC